MLEAAKQTFDQKEQELKQQLREQQQKYEDQQRQDQLKLEQMKKALDRGNSSAFLASFTQTI